MKQIAAFELVACAKSYIQPAYHYFDEELQSTEAAHYFLSSKLYGIKLTATDIESLHAFTKIRTTRVLGCC